MSANPEQQSGGHEDDRNEGGSSALERLLGAVGGVLVTGLLAFLAYQAVVVPNTGPQLSTEVQRIERVGEHFAVHVRVRNGGGETAEGVSVAGELRAAGGRVQRATTTLSYVPAQGAGHGALLFTLDPDNADLAVRATGYELP